MVYKILFNTFDLKCLMKMFGHLTTNQNFDVKNGEYLTRVVVP